MPWLAQQLGRSTLFAVLVSDCRADAEADEEQAGSVRLRRAIGIAVVTACVLAAAGAGLLIWSIADAPPSLTTDTDSKQLKTSAERVAFLSRYLKLRTRVTDAAFRIVWHDNSSWVPGPSDWAVVAAVQVTPTDGPTWLAGAQAAPLTETLPSPGKRLIPAEWKVSSPGVSYTRGSTLLVWHSEDVLEIAASSE